MSAKFPRGAIGVHAAQPVAADREDGLSAAVRTAVIPLV